jgi:hypothetical protein
MRWVVCVLLATCGLGMAGCGPSRSFDGPTVDAFVGRLTVDGKPVAFREGEDVTLKVFLHDKGQSFGVPIQPDGTFKLGWMPIGKYSMMLMRDAKKSKMPPTRYNVPGVLTIKEGQTEYTIDLGKGFTP